MCKFKSALIARFETETILHWEFHEDSHSELMESLVKQRGEPLEVCPIEVTGGKIKIDLENDQKEPWMEGFVSIHKKEILDIEVQTLEWMRTYELSELNIQDTKGFVIPKGSEIRVIYAGGAENLVFEGPVVADYLSINWTKNVVIPKGSKIKEIDAYLAKGLVFEGPIVADYLDVRFSENVVIPKGSKIREIRTFGANGFVIEEGC